MAMWSMMGCSGTTAAAAASARVSVVVAMQVVLLVSFCAVGGAVESSSVEVALAELGNDDHLVPFAILSGWEVVHSRGRSLLQNVVPTSNGSYILAADRTDRPDILHHFHRYHGGWDIRNQSYWSSAGYTGLPGFILALLWLALGLLLLIALCGCLCCCRHHMKHEHDHGAAGYYIPLALLLLFTAAAIGGCYALFAGQQKFHNELTSTLNYVLNQSYTTVQGLHNVSGYLSQASTINVETYGLPAADKQKLLDLDVQINQAASSLQNSTDSNAHNIQRDINNVRLALIITAGVMLLLVLLGLVFSACGIRPVVYFLVVVGWILVVGTWILCGVFILLHSVMGDTCVAMQEWVAHPYASTSLDAILPCVAPQTGANALLEAKSTVSTIANNANTAITVVINNNNKLAPPPLFYNQSGPAVPALCNPYGPAPNYAETPCPAGSLELVAAPSAWSKYICPSTTGICTGPGRLTQAVYSQLAAAANVSYGLHQYGPFLVDLQDCQTVRNTFTGINNQHCPNLRKYTRWVWIGLATISCGSMLSILLWMIYIRRRNMRYRNRNGTRQSKA